MIIYCRLTKDKARKEKKGLCQVQDLIDLFDWIDHDKGATDTGSAPGLKEASGRIQKVDPTLGSSIKPKKA